MDIFKVILFFCFFNAFIILMIQYLQWRSFPIYEFKEQLLRDAADLLGTWYVSTLTLVLVFNIPSIIDSITRLWIFFRTGVIL